MLRENDYVKAELELADLLGLNNLHSDEGAFYTHLYGRPPASDIGGRTRIPAWCRRWEGAGSLIAPHGIQILAEYEYTVQVRYSLPDGEFKTIGEHIYNHSHDADAALRYAIVRAVICKLRSAKHCFNELKEENK
ncbi:MAG: hypothetical protein NVS3B3_04370 [Aquirhabdus sp.]